MSESFKPAVIVGKVVLQPRKEVVMAKKPTGTTLKVHGKGGVEFEAPPRQERPQRRQERPSDPRTVNTAQLAELQYLKKQIAKLQAQAKLDQAVRTTLTSLVAELQKPNGGNITVGEVASARETLDAKLPE